MSLKQRDSVSKYVLVGGIVFLAFALIMPVSSLANSISRGYNTSDSELVVGMAAALSEDSISDNSSVERATISNKDRFVGITTTREASSITVANKSSEVIITTQGNVKALVSDVQGGIKKGDALTLSPIKGFLMKMNTEATLIVGFAIEDLSTDLAKTEKFKTEDGGETETRLGSISVDLLPPKDQITQGDKQSSSLVTFAKNLTGREVSPWKIFAAVLTFFILLVSVGSIVYGATHNTIGALGRNPLAKKEIYRHLIRIMSLALILIILGAAILYNLLWM